MCFSREERVLYDITHSKDIENVNEDFKKVIRNLGRENRNFFLKKTSFRNLGPRNFSPSPKLGARSPPMANNNGRSLFPETRI